MERQFDTVVLGAGPAVIAVGSSALFPPIPGLAEVGAWSNRELTTAAAVPPRLLILGGGVVGVEMARAWAWYGCSVTVVEAVDRLISREEPFASRAVQEALEQAGVSVELGVTVGAAERGLEVVVIDLDTSGTAGASFYGRGTNGTTRFVIDAARDVLVGVTFAAARRLRLCAEPVDNARV